jgi:hypothetical protein
MKVIGGKQLPTIWSDLSVSRESLESLDTEPAVSIVCVADWINKYHDFPPDTCNINLVDELYKEGIELLFYLPTVFARVHSLNLLYKIASEKWTSATKASFPGEKLSEAARDRMILVEEKYIIYQENLAMLERNEKWCTDMVFALKDALNELNMRMKRIISEQPPTLK